MDTYVFQSIVIPFYNVLFFFNDDLYNIIKHIFYMYGCVPIVMLLFFTIYP